MEINLDWQKKATIFFAVIVLIFSIILTVVAIREAERDKLVKQNEIRKDQERIVSSINSQVQTKIQRAEELCFSVLGPDVKSRGEGQWEEIAAQLKEREPLIAEIFYFESGGRIRFPLFKPLYRLDGKSASVNKGSKEIEHDPLFRSAEEAEFKTRNYSRAVDDYRQLLRSTSDRTSRALLLNRIARGYKLAGRLERAVQTYRQIVENHPFEYSADGIPFALIAMYQMAGLSSDRGNDDASIHGYLDLYHALLEPRWEISQAQFTYYKKAIEAKFDALKQSLTVEDIDAGIASRWEEIKNIEREKFDRMKRIELIAKKMGSIFRMNQADTASHIGEFFHFAEKLVGDPLLVSYTFPDSDSMFGFSIDYEHLRNEILPSIMADESYKDGFAVQVVDIEGHVVAEEENHGQLGVDPQSSFSQGFDGNFPPWTVQLIQTSPSEADKQFNMRRSIYILSVLVVVVAILFGGVLAIRSTAKELRLAKLKSDFVATVSHEFRTPLTSIRYLAELLQRGRVAEESKKQQYYETITHESERLSRLIENILDFSKIEAGMKEYEFEKTDVVEMCRDLVSRFQEQVAAQEFVIDNKIPAKLPKIFADREALSRALFNLLDNAVKYSGENRKIEFRVGTDEDKVFLKVKDRGFGIHEDDREKVFEKFYRSGDIQNSTIKGSGIGLTLVLHIAKAHGGEVILDSEPGKGTEVTIRIPIDRKD